MYDLVKQSFFVALHLLRGRTERKAYCTVNKVSMNNEQRTKDQAAASYESNTYFT